ncbi:MAG TPA: hypothetical protein VFV35_08210 [Acidimicrobiales bacterium]|nr:hypothetical protein [Acidimicrobiales bacterium]
MRRVGVYVWRSAVQKGALGGNRTWMAVFAAMAAGKILRRIGGNVSQTVYSEPLRPGESLIITHLHETTGRAAPATMEA